MRSKLTYVFIILITLSSCINHKEPDHSLSREEYLKLGFPDYKKEWTLNDYSIAYRVLLKLKNEKPYSLPVKTSKKSGVFFDRIINLDNFSFLQKKSIPLHEKAYRLSDYLRVEEDFIDLYTDIYNEKQYYNTELAYLYILGINITQMMIDLGAKINDSDVPCDVKMQSGYKAIQSIYHAGLNNVLKDQSHTSLYKQKDLEVVADSLSMSVRRNITWFNHAQKNNLIQNLQVVIDSTNSAKIRDEYTGLIETLQ